MTGYSISLEYEHTPNTRRIAQWPDHPARTRPTGNWNCCRSFGKTGPCSLGQICTALRLRRPIATTTVATILKVMLDKKLVHRKRTPQGYLWSAKTTRQTAAAGMVRKLRRSRSSTDRPNGSSPTCWNPINSATANAKNSAA